MSIRTSSLFLSTLARTRAGARASPHESTGALSILQTTDRWSPIVSHHENRLFGTSGGQSGEAERVGQHFRRYSKEERIEDLKVGDFGEVRRYFPMSSVKAFAELSGDMNPLHLDPEEAAQSRFGRPIVHGMLVSSLFSTIFGTHFPGAIYVRQELAFRAPVYVDSHVTAVCTVTEIDPARKFVTCSTECFVDVEREGEGSEQRAVVIRGKATVLLPSLDLISSETD